MLGHKKYTKDRDNWQIFNLVLTLYKLLALTKLKAFTDNKFNVAYMMISVSEIKQEGQNGPEALT